MDCGLSFEFKEILREQRVRSQGHKHSITRPHDSGWITERDLAEKEPGESLIQLEHPTCT